MCNRDIEKYTYYNLCIGGVWIVMRYFLFEKQTFNGLIKIIGIQNILNNFIYKYSDMTRVRFGNSFFIESNVPSSNLSQENSGITKIKWI